MAAGAAPQAETARIASRGRAEWATVTGLWCLRACASGGCRLLVTVVKLVASIGLRDKGRELGALLLLFHTVEEHPPKEPPDEVADGQTERKCE